MLFIFIHIIVSLCFGSGTYCNDPNNVTVLIEEQPSSCDRNGWKWGTWNELEPTYESYGLIQSDICMDQISSACDGFIFDQCEEELTIINEKWSGNKFITIVKGTSLKTLIIEQRNTEAKFWIHSFASDSIRIIFKQPNKSNKPIVLTTSSPLYFHTDNQPYLDIKTKTFPSAFLEVTGYPWVFVSSYDQNHPLPTNTNAIFIGEKSVQPCYFENMGKQPQQLCNMGDMLRYGYTEGSDCSCVLEKDIQYNYNDCLYYHDYFNLIVNKDNLTATNTWKKLIIQKEYIHLIIFNTLIINQWESTPTIFIGNLEIGTLTYSKLCWFDSIKIGSLSNTKLSVNSILFYAKNIVSLPSTLKQSHCELYQGYDRIVSSESTSLCYCTPTDSTLTSFKEWDCQNTSSKNLMITNDIFLKQTMKWKNVSVENSVNINISDGYQLIADMFICKGKVHVDGETIFYSLYITNECQLIFSVFPNISNVIMENKNAIVFIAPFSVSVPEAIEIGCSINPQQTRYLIKGNQIGCGCSIQSSSDNEIEQWDCLLNPNVYSLYINTTNNITINYSWKEIRCIGSESTLLLKSKSTIVAMGNIQVYGNYITLLNITDKYKVAVWDTSIETVTMPDDWFYISNSKLTNPTNTFSSCEISPFRISYRLTSKCECSSKDKILNLTSNYNLWDCADYSKSRDVLIEDGVEIQSDWNKIIPKGDISFYLNTVQINTIQCLSNLNIFGNNSFIKLMQYGDIIPQIKIDGNVQISQIDIMFNITNQVLFLSSIKQPTPFYSNCFIEDKYYRISLQQIGCDCVWSNSTFGQWDCLLYSPYLCLIINSESIYEGPEQWDMLMVTKLIVLTTHFLNVTSFEPKFDFKLNGRMEITTLVINDYNPFLNFGNDIVINEVITTLDSTKVLFVGILSNELQTVSLQCKGTLNRYTLVTNKSINCDCQRKGDIFVQNDCLEFSTERTLVVNNNVFTVDTPVKWKEIDVRTTDMTLINGKEMTVGYYKHKSPVIFDINIRIETLDFSYNPERVEYLRFSQKSIIKDLITTNVNNNAILFIASNSTCEIFSGIIGIVCNDNNYSRFGFKNNSIGCDCKTSLINDSDTFDVFDCFYDQAEITRNLVVIGKELRIEKNNTHWNSLLFTDSTTTINGNLFISFNKCVFDDFDITIQTPIKCNSINVNSNSRIYLNELMTIDKLNMHLISNINKEVIFQERGIGKMNVNKIEIDPQQMGCFELLSSKKIRSVIETIQEKYKQINLSNETLMRICPINDINNEVTCNINSKWFNSTFSISYCPCQGNECYFIPQNELYMNCEKVQLKLESNLILYQSGIVTMKSNHFSISLNSLCSNNIITFDDIDLLEIHQSEIQTSLKGNLINTLNVTNPIKILTDISINKLVFNNNTISLTETVNQIQLNSIISDYDIQNEVFSINPSPNQIYFNLNPQINNTNNIIILVRVGSRSIKSTFPLSCDKRVILLGAEDNENTCRKLNLIQQFCYVTGDYLYVDINDYPDYSCPCNTVSPNCTVTIKSSYSNNVYSLNGVNPSTLIIEKNIIITDIIKKTISIEQNVQKLILNTTHSTLSFNTLDTPVNVYSTDGTLILSTNPLMYSILKTGISNSFLIEPNGNCFVQYFVETTNCLICDESHYYRNANGTCSTIEPTDPLCISYGFHCYQCSSTHYLENGICKECSKKFEFCNTCNFTQCLSCMTNYSLNTMNNCVLSSSYDLCEWKTSVCMKCVDGYQFDVSSGNCKPCPSNCLVCDNNTCILCEKNTTWDGISCINSSSVELYIYGKQSKCQNGYVSIEGICHNCSERYGHCLLCDEQTCHLCEEGYVILSNGQCISKEQCHCLETTNKSQCYQCEEGFYLSKGQCTKCIDGCSYCLNENTCEKCLSEFILVGGLCEKITNEVMEQAHCVEYKNGRCSLCETKYYLDDSMKCVNCPDNCTSCTSQGCISCDQGYIVQSYLCIYSNQTHCLIPFFNDAGCVICEDGYFINKTTCSSCKVFGECIQCSFSGCTNCSEGYYLNGVKCSPISELEHCLKVDYTVGCISCENGYRITQDSHCTTCEANCKHCTSIQCIKCNKEYVLNKNDKQKCVSISTIEHCITSDGQICTKCSFFYHLKNNNCTVNIIAVILISLIIFISISAIIIGIIIYIAIKINKYKKNDLSSGYINIDSGLNIFSIRYSNIHFYKFNNYSPLVFDKQSLLFDEGPDRLPVGVESRTILYVGNDSKNKIFIQFTYIETQYPKYSLRIVPQTICLPEGEACEVEIYITPLCSGSMNDSIVIISNSSHKKYKMNDIISFSYTTQMSTHIDYDDLIEEKKIGEGSFGIVYLGIFRGNKVAIKRLKQLQCEEDELEEFEKEIDMLDKFRSDYIVYFYGAVFIPSKMCIVTEFAKYGSLRDLMKNKNLHLKPRLKIKFMIDTAKGIQYLHSNGILHRDIKPDNILIFSLEEGVAVNTKLTDFGSSRNFNLLLTNITFTKSVGTPAYMAPEILCQSKYGTPIDIFSFSIVLYEIWKWDKAYLVEEFKFPWKIADFVCDGKRLLQPEGMPDWYYILICKCWQNNPQERLSINEIMQVLNFAFNTLLSED
ncbi:serine/threonine kinase, putative [Entamoeba histolytica KU27]|uniref:Serine/threonine kinase, putative n=1 Tax=Entamoeba histolytica KU27 TaxID=885311 RepID=M2S2Y2_ENTHI|nr:serine/threonine kinase, putative [Entamoeba histolytica KU27]